METCTSFSVFFFSGRFNFRFTTPSPRFTYGGSILEGTRETHRKMCCRRGQGRAGMSSVPEHASGMRGKSLPCWCLSDLVQINAWRDHALNLCQMANNIGMHNLVVLHVPHDSVVGICTPNKQRSLQIIWACYSILRIKGSRQRAGYSTIL